MLDVGCSLIAFRNVAETWCGRGVFGGCYNVATAVEPDLSWLLLDKDQDVTGLRQAQEMLEFVVHDPSVKRKQWACYSLAAVPLAYQAGQQRNSPVHEHGLRETLQLVGQVLLNCPTVRTVCFDNAAAHAWVKELLLGEASTAALSAASSVPFFGELVWHNCPSSVLPRWPYRLAVFQGDGMFCINAPLHVVKNSVSALRSSVRLVFFGDYSCSTAQLSEHGLPPASWMGVDSQSDTWRLIECCMFC